MKPNSSKKIGYSLKDTFVMIIKCLVLTFAFFFIGINAKQDKVSADVSIMRTEGRNFNWITATASDGKGGYTAYEYKQTTNYTYYVARLYMHTTDTGTSPTSIYVKQGSTTLASQDLVSVLRDEYINIVYMDRTSAYNCGHNYITLCSSAPSGFDFYGLTVLVPYNYMSKTLTVGGTGSSWNLFSGTTYYSASATVKVHDYGNPILSSVTLTNSYNNKWTNTNVTVSFSGVKDHYGSSLKYYLCTKEGTTYIPQTSSFTSTSYTFSSNRSQTLYLLAEDAAGNKAYSSVYTTVKIDKTAPTMTGTFTVVDGDSSNDGITPAYGFTNSILLKVATMPSITESGGSGIKNYQIIDHSANDKPSVYYAVYDKTTKPTTSTTLYFYQNVLGTHEIGLRVYDNAGNVATVFCTIFYQTAPSTISSFIISDGALSDNYVTPQGSYTNSRLIKTNIELVCATTLCSYKIDDGSTTIYSTSTTSPDGRTMNLATTTTGKHLLTLFVYDQAGNVATISRGIYYYPKSFVLAYNVSICMYYDDWGDCDHPYINRTEDLLLEAEYEDCSDQADFAYAWEVFQDDESIHYELADKGSFYTYIFLDDLSLYYTYEDVYEITFCVYDVIGNRSCTYYVFDLDMTDPEINGTFTVKGNATAQPGYTNQRDVVINLSEYAYDDYSGVEYYEIEVIGESWDESQIYHHWDKPTNFVYTLEDSDENIEFYLYVCDYATNCIDDYYFITLDRQAPRFSGSLKITDNDESNNYYKPSEHADSYGWTNSDSVKFISVPTVSEENRVYVYTVTEVVYVNDEQQARSIPDGSPVSVNSTWTLQDYEGVHSFSYCAKDYAGNLGCLASGSVTYIKTAPTMEGTLTIIDGDTSNNAVIAQDGFTNSTTIKAMMLPTITYPSVSSVSESNYAYDISDNGTIQKLSGKLTVNGEFSIGSAEGLHTIKYIVYDYAGNKAEKTTTIIYDKTAPVVTLPNQWIKGNANADAGYTNQRVLSIASIPTVTETNKWKYELKSKVNGTTTTNYTQSTTNITTSTKITLSDVNGTHLVTYYVYDAAGNVGYKSSEMIYLKSGPTGATIACDPYCDAWTRDKVTVTLSGAKDAISGAATHIKGYKYSYDNTNYNVPSVNSATEAKPYWDSEQNITVYFRVYDKAGNYTLIGQKQIMIDRSAPQFGEISCDPYCDEWTNQTVTVTLSGATDSLSGIKEYRYSYDNVTYNVPSTSSATEAKPYWSTNTNRIVYFRVYDNAGNYKDLGSKWIMVDVGAPDVSGATIVCDPICNAWTNEEEIKVRVSGASDGYSGIKEYRYSEDNGQTYSVLTKSVVDDVVRGEHTWKSNVNNTIHIRVYDNAGNWQDIGQVKVQGDKSRPEITSFSAIDGDSSNGLGLAGYTNNKSIKISQASNDTGGSGISRYVIKDGNIVIYDSSVNPDGKIDELANATDGVHTLKLYVYDVAGNVSEETVPYSYNIELDTVSQKITLNGQTSEVSNVAPGSRLTLAISDKNAVDATYNGKKAYYYMTVEELTGATFKLITTKQIGFNASSDANKLSVVDMSSAFNEESYYIYIFIETSVARSWEKAGNGLAHDFVVGAYEVKKFKITPSSEPADIKDFTYGEYEEEDEFNTFERTMIDDKEILLATLGTTVTNNGVSEFDFKTPLEALYGVNMVTEVTSTESHAYTVILELKSDSNYFKALTLVVLNEAPKLVLDTATSPVSLEVNKGEEISNVGLSFKTSNTGDVVVDTLITLDGVRVKKVDTNVTGVYNIVQVARDGEGRSHTVKRQVVVKDEEVVENIIVSKEEIKEEVRLEVPVVETQVKVNQEAQAETRVEVETNRVEMRLEKETKVKGYKKKKEIKQVRKESFTFKLFSKYFFKIYDG